MLVREGANVTASDNVSGGREIETEIERERERERKREIIIE